MRKIIGLAGAIALAGCGAIGPRAPEILNSEHARVVTSEYDQTFAVVPIDSANARLATQWLQKGVVTRFIGDTGTGPVRIGKGDVLQISIVSTNEAGFVDFANSSISPISTTSFPPLTVNSDGMISVPPIGRIRAEGNTVQSLQEVLQRRLGDVLVDPSVIVEIVERRSARVSLLGSVGRPGAYSLDLNNMHLLELLAQAGGPSGRPENLEISVSRQGATGRAPLNRVYETPQLNIHLRAGDVISVQEDLKRLVVLGATGSNTTLEYTEPELSLAEALGRAGGPVNRRANRKGVFVYREIPAEAAAAFGIPGASYTSGMVPTIFNIDMSQPTSLFAAKEFLMAENDLIYIANSLNDEISAVFGAISPFVPAPAVYVRDATTDN